MTKDELRNKLIKLAKSLEDELLISLAENGECEDIDPDIEILVNNLEGWLLNGHEKKIERERRKKMAGFVANKNLGC